MNEFVTGPPFFKKPEFSIEENVQADIRLNFHHPVNGKIRRVTTEETHCLFPLKILSCAGPLAVKRGKSCVYGFYPRLVFF